jgi:hypothetical protein
MAKSIPIAFTRSRSQPTPVRKAYEVVPSLPIATSRIARDSGASQTYYQGTVIDVQRIQNALRAGERGNTWLLCTLIRDMIASFTHLTAQWAIRKNVIYGQPMSLLPADASNPDDVMAVNVIQEAIDNCDNWQEGIKGLLDATLYPLSLAEKIYDPINQSDRKSKKFKYLRQYRLKELAYVNPQLFCFQVPYQGAIAGWSENIRANSNVAANQAAQFNPDEWERWLRLYDTMPNGSIDYNVGDVYAPTKNVHIIHRGGGQISPAVPPNFMGEIRKCLFLWLLATQGRDWWSLMMSKFAMPILVGKVNTSDAQAVNYMQSALSLATQLGGIVIDKKAALENVPVAGIDGSQGHKLFQDFILDEVSKIVVGQTTSARPPKGGLAGGMAEQSEKVRDDIRIADMTNFAWTLSHQLFPQILELNMYRPGRVLVSWGGINPEEMKLISQSAGQMYPAGIRLAKEGIATWNQKTGLMWERVPDNLMQAGKQKEDKPLNN